MKKLILPGLLLFIGLTAFRFLPEDYKTFFRMAEHADTKTLTVVVQKGLAEDDQLQQAVKNRWTYTKVEFVSPQEVDLLAGDTGRIFLYKAWLTASAVPLADYRLILSQGKRSAKKVTETTPIEHFEFFIVNNSKYKSYDRESEFRKLPYLQVIGVNRIQLSLIAGAKANRDIGVHNQQVMAVFKPKKSIPPDMAGKKIYYDKTLIPAAEMEWFIPWSKIDPALFTGVDSEKLADIMHKNEKDVLLITKDGESDGHALYSLYNQEGKIFFSNSITHN